MKNPQHLKYSVHRFFSRLFSLLFLFLCIAILMSTISTLVEFFFSSAIFYAENEIPEVVINAISNLIIALAMFELYLVINIDDHPGLNEQTLHVLLDSAPRFIIVVCVALALEGLVLVIKLSQDEKTEELLAPIVVIISAAVLLISLGVFLKVCPRSPRSESSDGKSPDTPPNSIDSVSSASQPNQPGNID